MRLRSILTKHKWYSVSWLIFCVIGFLLIPKDLLHSHFAGVGYVFSMVFATTSVCTISSVRENFHRQRLAGKSYIGIFISVIGLVGLQACGIGGAFCGATTGMSILSVVFPAFMVSILHMYGVYIVLVSVILQLFFLYYFGCLERMKRSLNHAVKQG